MVLTRRKRVLKSKRCSCCCADEHQTKELNETEKRQDNKRISGNKKNDVKKSKERVKNTQELPTLKQVKVVLSKIDTNVNKEKEETILNSNVLTRKQDRDRQRKKTSKQTKVVEEPKITRNKNHGIKDKENSIVVHSMNDSKIRKGKKKTVLNPIVLIEDVEEHKITRNEKNGVKEKESSTVSNTSKEGKDLQYKNTSEQTKVVEEHRITRRKNNQIKEKDISVVNNTSKEGKDLQYKNTSKESKVVEEHRITRRKNNGIKEKENSVVSNTSEEDKDLQYKNTLEQTKVVEEHRITRNKNTGIKERKVSKEQSLIKDCLVILERVNNNDHPVAQKKTKVHQKMRNNISFKTSTPIPKLRTRRYIKYAESSLEVTKNEEKSEDKKVPVYKQNVEEESKKRKTDQYEFDSDSEKQKKRKRRKVNNDESDDTMQMLDLKMQEKKKKNPSRKKVGVNHQKPKAHKVGVDPQVVIPVVKKTNTDSVSKRTNQISLKETPPQDTPTNQISLKETPPRDPPTNQISLKETPPQNPPTNEISPKETPPPDLSPPRDTDTYFSEDDFLTSPTSKIKILSNIQLKPPNELNLSLASPRLFENGRPNANSTMIQKNVLTPWRFNEINIRRNPHYISLKKSSLPSINQEMVLDHTIVEKLNETLRKENKKSLIQSIISDFFECNNDENKENEKVTNLSLFDNDQLSPIKSRREPMRNEQVKRRILGEKNENVQVVENRNETKNPEIRNFGFDSTDDEEEIFAPRKKEDGPFRMSVGANDRKYQRKRKVEFRKVELRKSDSLTSDESSEDSDVESYSGEAKLFDDFNTTKKIIEEQKEKTDKIEKIRTNRRKYKNKLKEKQTGEGEWDKDEEEEAERWAAAFNSMCEEVEQFPLEIE